MTSLGCGYCHDGRCTNHPGGDCYEPTPIAYLATQYAKSDTGYPAFVPRECRQYVLCPACADKWPGEKRPLDQVESEGWAEGGGLKCYECGMELVK